MKTQNPPEAKRRRSRRSDSLAAKVARRQSSQKYRWHNEDELREKARLRMAERRAGMKAEGVVSDSHAAGVKLANATYRARHRDLLAFKQRQRRQDAFISKYGRQAYQDRLAREKAKADAAMDAEWAAHMAAEEAERIAARSARVAARKLLTPSL